MAPTCDEDGSFTPTTRPPDDDVSSAIKNLDKDATAVASRSTDLEISSPCQHVNFTTQNLFHGLPTLAKAPPRQRRGGHHSTPLEGRSAQLDNLLSHPISSDPIRRIQTAVRGLLQQLPLTSASTPSQQQP
jgi:hypothetical protein